MANPARCIHHQLSFWIISNPVIRCRCLSSNRAASKHFVQRRNVFVPVMVLPAPEPTKRSPSFASGSLVTAPMTPFVSPVHSLNPQSSTSSPPMSGKPPFPPFTLETARQKARMAENAWNSKDPDKVSLAYTEDSVWRNRSEFIHGRAEILAFLKRKWAKELDYKLIKEVWACTDDHNIIRHFLSLDIAHYLKYILKVKILSY